MPLTPSATRELLARLGHAPKRFLGQNFLVDGNIVRKSLELA
jgi:16S rRNA (adenine1518-N6/adenine1519-N6)-dimethyltransferase